MDCTILVSVTKNKYSTLKYISSLSFGYQNNIIAWVYLTLLTKEIKPKNRNEVQYRDDVPTKRKVGM